MVEKNNRKKMIIIVEDDFDEFLRIKKCVFDPIFQIYPDKKEDWKIFRNAFQKALNPSDDDSGKNILWIKNKFKKNDISAFIIDFLLDGNDTEIVTGRKFYDFFIKNDYPKTRTMMLTRLVIDSKADTDALIINQALHKLKDEINSKNKSIIFDYRSKLFDNSVFCEDLKSFIHGTLNVVSRGTGKNEISKMEIIINEIKEYHLAFTNVKEQTKIDFWKLLEKILEQIALYKNNSDLLLELKKMTDITEGNLNSYMIILNKYIKGE